MAAQDHFASQAERTPRAGLPKIGYALAKAMRHDQSRAVWAMHRVLRYDPKAFDRVPDNDAQHARISRLIDRYHRNHDAYSDSGNAFLTASLAYIHGQSELARKALSQVISSGDRRGTTMKLKSMMEGKYARSVHEPNHQ